MSGGQALGAVVGGAIGFFVAGPAGAFYGASLGAGVGAALDPPKGPTVEGPRLSDLAVQTSTYGAFLPRVYGTIAGAGNIIQLENNKLKETVRKQSSGGKGGGGGATTKTYTYTYSATFQLALCEGPIAGVRRIWCGDKLIYNAGSNNLETIIASNNAAKGFRIYLGTDDQMPDPRYEAEYGVGNVSAHRGMAYIAFYDFQLADYSNTLQAAQFKVEIVSSGGLEPSAEQIVEIEQLTDAPQIGASFDGASVSVIRTGITKGSAGYVDGYYLERYSLSGARISFSQRVFADGATGSRIFPISNSAKEFICAGTGPSGYGYYLFSEGQIGAYIKATSTSWRSNIVSHGDFYYGVEFIPGNTTVLLYKRETVLNISLNPVMTFVNSFSQYSTVFDNNDIFLSISPGGETIAIHCKSDLLSDTFGPARTVTINTESMLPIGRSLSESDVIGVSEKGVVINTSGSVRILDVETLAVIELFAGEVDKGSSFGSTSLINELCIYEGNLIKLFTPIESDGPSLASVISSEVDLASIISSDDITTSALDRTVRGYRVQGGTIRAALEPLQAAFPFDVRQHGYKIQFLPRGQASMATIPAADLIADGDGRTFVQSREMDTQLPAKTVISYLDGEREYAVSEQLSSRLGAGSVNRVDRELPIVLTADEAAGVAEVLQFLPWLERTDGAFTLPPPYRYLEPGDVVTLAMDDASYELRLAEVNEGSDGNIECKSKPSRAALYTPNSTGAEGVAPGGEIPLGGPSVFFALDIPLIDESTQDRPGFVGAMTGYTAGWPGGLLIRSSDAGQTFVDIQAFAGKATIGTARTALAANDGALIDRRTVIVDVISGTLESVTQDQMLNGSNYAAYGADGRWEIVRFQTATLQADGSYLVSGFIRGDKGTEWATGLHAAGDALLMLNDPDNTFISMSVDSLQQERLYRAVTSGDSVDSAADINFTYRGVNLECLSPVYARATRDGSSNLSATFTRRSRISSSWWTTGVVAPVGEATEAYEIDVMSGSTVVRTISAATQAFSYSSANQVTDFGSAQASINFRIYQLSAVVGRGYPLEVTL